jgi:hypothetical protein
MLGIAPFSGLSFSSLPDIAEVVTGEAVIIGTADLSTLGGKPLSGTVNVYAIANLEVDSVDQDGGKSNMEANAELLAYANSKFVGVANIEGVATLLAKSGITGEGWVRVNPDTEEWDYTQSSDWNKIN